MLSIQLRIDPNELEAGCLKIQAVLLGDRICLENTSQMDQTTWHKNIPVQLNLFNTNSKGAELSVQIMEVSVF